MHPTLDLCVDQTRDLTRLVRCDMAILVEISPAGFHVSSSPVNMPIESYKTVDRLLNLLRICHFTAPSKARPNKCINPWFQRLVLQEWQRQKHEGSTWRRPSEAARWNGSELCSLKHDLSLCHDIILLLWNRNWSWHDRQCLTVVHSKNMLWLKIYTWLSAANDLCS